MKEIVSPKDTLIIKVTANITPQNFNDLYNMIYKEMVENHFVLLPPYCEVVVIPKGVKVKIKEDEIVRPVTPNYIFTSENSRG